MGCGVSKPEPDEEAPAGVRPPHRRRLIHLRRAARSRKDSIVSTTELLRTEEFEDSASTDRDGKPPLPPLPEGEGGYGQMAAARVKADDDERRRLGCGGKGRRMAGGDDEDLPGSPSFRFYFDGPVGQGGHPVVMSEDGSIKNGSRDSSM